MNIIGRKKEQDILNYCLTSSRPEFLAVYGRRRVGKTFLVREYFNNQFAFYTTGVERAKTREQLTVFYDSLKKYGDKERKAPKNWFEAFARLRTLLETGNIRRDAVSGKMVVFFDELPWMDTPRSDFKAALEYFWNGWGSARPDLLFIVCGSATSWIIDYVLMDHGGMYNRVTRQLQLLPFNLCECELLAQNNGLDMTRKQLLEYYMVFGGIPYYLNLLDRRLSLSQNIDQLLINENGELHYEFDRLLKSLFRNPGKHMRILKEIAKKKSGVLRTELESITDIGGGEQLTKTLNELEQCGFIRKFRNFAKKQQGCYYQVIDPFILFSVYYQDGSFPDSWSSYIDTPAFYTWRGNAFEILCLNHIMQIKTALGISGMDSSEYAWRSKQKKDGAQIDLLIDRKDDVINICEMKCTDSEYIVDDELEEKMYHRRDLFRAETGLNKAVHFTLILSGELKRNAHSDVFQNVITGEYLFSDH